MESNHEFDVALSFAGEDRSYVDEVAAALKKDGIKVFYDRYEQVDLWGKDLYTHLRKVYQQQARFTVVFISRHYAKKLWTNHERESAQARAFTESTEYLLPVRFDDTEVPGILPTTGYLDLRQMSPADLAVSIKLKLGVEDDQSRDEEALPLPFIAPSDGPAIVWRMPRGFLLLEDVVSEPHESWAVRIEHYGYDGEDFYGTHYHESYGRYWEDVGGIETQCRKLDIPFADWPFASGALDLVRDIRHGQIVVDTQGNLIRNGRPYQLSDGRVAVYPTGIVPRQNPPFEYTGLQLTGPVRDVIAEAEDLIAPDWRRKSPRPDDIRSAARGLRRSTRIAISKLFAPDDPARINVEEVLSDFSRDATEDEAKIWLRELADAVREASAEVRMKYEPRGGAA